MKKHQPPKRVEIHNISIPREIVSKLNNNERWSYYLMGYIINELNIIVKLLSHSLHRQLDDREFTNTVEMVQVSMLFRLAAGKCHEAMLQLRSREFHDVFANVIVKHAPIAKTQWDELNKKYKSAKWLGKLRNGVIFHYPSPSEWIPITKPDKNWQNDEFYFSKALWSNFSGGSEIIAQFWALITIANGKPPTTKEEATVLYNHLVTTTIDLLNLLIDFLNTSLAAFIDGHMYGGKTPVKTLGTVSAIKADSVKIPLWLYME